jgi:hypothetical protein
MDCFLGRIWPQKSFASANLNKIFIEKLSERKDASVFIFFSLALARRGGSVDIASASEIEDPGSNPVRVQVF